MLTTGLLLGLVFMAFTLLLLDLLSMLFSTFFSLTLLM